MGDGGGGCRRGRERKDSGEGDERMGEMIFGAFRANVNSRGRGGVE